MKSQITFFSLGTVNTLLAYGPNATVALGKVQKRIEEIDDEMSVFKEDSIVRKINQQAGLSPVVVPKDIFDVLSCSKEIAKTSEGAFDISVRPLSQLWGFGTKLNFIPPAKDIQGLLLGGLVDFRQLVLNPKEQTVFLSQKGMSIDLGGIAKGYAADEAKRILKEEGITAGLINLGGNVLGLGSFDKGKPWKVGIRNPFTANGEYFTIMSITEETVVTSGIDQQLFIQDGVVYHHILDPRTGYPSQSGLVSVTVIGKESMVADGLATACFVLGKDKGAELAKKEGYQTLFVTKEGNVYSSFQTPLATPTK